MQRKLVVIVFTLILLTAGCIGQDNTELPPAQTVTPQPRITLLPSSTPLPPTATTPLIGSPTPTPHPTDDNSMKPIFRSQAETSNQGEHTYTYSCIAWAPCNCMSVVPRQIDISFNFYSQSVDLMAGDYTQTYQWVTANAYETKLGTLSTQLTFAENGFELYTVIDERSCTQEQYTLAIETP